MKTLVLGLGNDLYGDDGIGLHVVRRLKEELEKHEDTPEKSAVVLEECCLSGLALLEVIAGHERLILIDTIKKDHPSTGSIHILGPEDIRAIPGPSPHYVSLPQAVDMGRQLGVRVPDKITIVAVEAKNIFHLGEGLSLEMNRALPRIIEKVKEILRQENALKNA